MTCRHDASRGYEKGHRERETRKSKDAESAERKKRPRKRETQIAKEEPKAQMQKRETEIQSAEDNNAEGRTSCQRPLKVWKPENEGIHKRIA